MQVIKKFMKPPSMHFSMLSWDKTLSSDLYVIIPLRYSATQIAVTMVTNDDVSNKHNTLSKHSLNVLMI